MNEQPVLLYLNIKAKKYITPVLAVVQLNCMDIVKHCSVWIGTAGQSVKYPGANTIQTGQSAQVNQQGSVCVPGNPAQVENSECWETQHKSGSDSKQLDIVTGTGSDSCWEQESLRCIISFVCGLLLSHKNFHSQDQSMKNGMVLVNIEQL